MEKTTKTRRKQLDCAKRYDEKFDKFPVRIPKEKRPSFDEKAAKYGISLNELFLRAVEAYNEEK